MKSVQEILIGAYSEDAPAEYVMAAHWLQGQLKHVPEDKQLEWVKEFRDRDRLDDVHGMALTNYYLNNNLTEQFEYEKFMSSVAYMCVSFYQFNGGKMDDDTLYFMEKNRYSPANGAEGVPNVISEGKNGKGKFIVSSIL